MRKSEDLRQISAWELAWKPHTGQTFRQHMEDQPIPRFTPRQRLYSDPYAVGEIGNRPVRPAQSHNAHAALQDCPELAARVEGMGMEKQESKIYEEKLEEEKRIEYVKKQIRVKKHNAVDLRQPPVQCSHRLHERYGSHAGKHSVANSLTAVMMSKMKNILTWTTNDIDDVLDEGTAFYNDMLGKHKIKGNAGYIEMSELPDTYKTGRGTFSVHMGNSFLGKVKVERSDAEMADSALAFDEALQNALLNFEACLVIFGENTCAVIQQDKWFAVFDPNPRNKQATEFANGRAVVLYYSTLEKLLAHLGNLSNSLCEGSAHRQSFEITGITTRMIPDTEDHFNNKGGSPVESEALCTQAHGVRTAPLNCPEPLSNEGMMGVENRKVERNVQHERKEEKKQMENFSNRRAEREETAVPEGNRDKDKEQMADKRDKQRVQEKNVDEKTEVPKDRIKVRDKSDEERQMSTMRTCENMTQKYRLHPKQSLGGCTDGQDIPRFSPKQRPSVGVDAAGEIKNRPVRPPQGHNMQTAPQDWPDLTAKVEVTGTEKLEEQNCKVQEEKTEIEKLIEEYYKNKKKKRRVKREQNLVLDGSKEKEQVEDKNHVLKEQERKAEEVKTFEQIEQYWRGEETEEEKQRENSTARTAEDMHTSAWKPLIGQTSKTHTEDRDIPGFSPKQRTSPNLNAASKISNHPTQPTLGHKVYSAPQDFPEQLAREVMGMEKQYSKAHSEQTKVKHQKKTEDKKQSNKKQERELENTAEGGGEMKVEWRGLSAWEPHLSEPHLAETFRLSFCLSDEDQQETKPEKNRELKENRRIVEEKENKNLTAWAPCFTEPMTDFFQSSEELKAKPGRTWNSKVAEEKKKQSTWEPHLSEPINLFSFFFQTHEELEMEADTEKAEEECEIVVQRKSLPAWEPHLAEPITIFAFFLSPEELDLKLEEQCSLIPPGAVAEEKKRQSVWEPHLAKPINMFSRLFLSTDEQLEVRPKEENEEEQKTLAEEKECPPLKELHVEELVDMLSSSTEEMVSKPYEENTEVEQETVEEEQEKALSTLDSQIAEPTDMFSPSPAKVEAEPLEQKEDAEEAEEVEKQSLPLWEPQAISIFSTSPEDLEAIPEVENAAEQEMVERESPPGPGFQEAELEAKAVGRRVDECKKVKVRKATEWGRETKQKGERTEQERKKEVEVRKKEVEERKKRVEDKKLKLELWEKVLRDREKQVHQWETMASEWLKAVEELEKKVKEAMMEVEERERAVEERRESRGKQTLRCGHDRGWSTSRRSSSCIGQSSGAM